MKFNDVSTILEDRKYSRIKDELRDMWGNGYNSGTEAMVSAVSNMLTKDGIDVDRTAIRKYIIDEKNKNPPYMQRIRKRGEALGMGEGQKGKTKANAAGRRYVYYTLHRIFYNHFKSLNK